MTAPAFARGRSDPLSDILTDLENLRTDIAFLGDAPPFAALDKTAEGFIINIRRVQEALKENK
jgi:hypothetical protein